jgi:hypothetical protein
MIEAIQANYGVDKSNPLVQNLLRAIQRTYQHPSRTEDNYDWQLWGLLLKILESCTHHFSYTPKHSTYNSSMYDIGKFLNDPTSKWFEFDVIIGDFDKDPNTLLDVGILD